MMVQGAIADVAVIALGAGARCDRAARTNVALSEPRRPERRAIPSRHESSE
jgi:hypothetical protein